MQARLARWRKQQQGAQEQLKLLPKSAQRRSGLEACGQGKRVDHESLVEQCLQAKRTRKRKHHCSELELVMETFQQMH